MSDLKFNKDVNTFPTCYEPKLNNRFLVHFPKGFDIPEWLTYKVIRPSYNGSTKSWTNMEIHLRDGVSVSATKEVMNGLNQIGISQDPTRKFRIASVDPTGLSYEMIEVSGVIDEVKFSDLDYSDDSISTVIMKINVSKVEILDSW